MPRPPPAGRARSALADRARSMPYSAVTQPARPLLLPQERRRRSSMVAAQRTWVSPARSGRALGVLAGSHAGSSTGPQLVGRRPLRVGSARRAHRASPVNARTRAGRSGPTHVDLQSIGSPRNRPPTSANFDGMSLTKNRRSRRPSLAAQQPEPAQLRRRPARDRLLGGVDQRHARPHDLARCTPLSSG